MIPNSNELSQIGSDDCVELLRLLDEQEARLCEERFSAFVQFAWPVVEPGIDLQWNWHYGVICDELQAVVERIVNKEDKPYDLIFNIPPRTLKSTIISVMWNAWTWIKYPRLRFLTTSYSDKLAYDHSWRTRLLLQSSWYQINWGSRFAFMPDQNVKTFFSNDKTGYRVGAGRGGTSTGTGGDVVITDDPQSAEEALSESSRASVIDWWTNTMHSRLNDQRIGVRVIIQQRLHENDLTGYELENNGDNYKYYCFPAESSYEVHPSEFAEKYIDGLLQPNKLPRDILDKTRKSTSSYVYAGQYGQSPVPATGGLFKKYYWKFWVPEGMTVPSYQSKTEDGGIFTHETTFLPREFENKVIAWDASFKGTAGSDRCAGQVWGLSGEREFLLDEDCGTYDFLEFVKHVKSLYRSHHDVYYVIIEDKANGPAAISSLRAEIPCLLPVEANASKLARATGNDGSRAVSLLARAEAGNVCLPHPTIAAWVEDFMDEFAKFPRGRYDDRIDSGVHAHKKLTEVIPGFAIA